MSLTSLRTPACDVSQRVGRHSAGVHDADAAASQPAQRVQERRRHNGASHQGDLTAVAEERRDRFAGPKVNRDQSGFDDDIPDDGDLVP